MSLYMVSYDLNKPGQDYKKVTDKIESLGSWCHYLDSTYLVKSYLNFETFQKEVTSVADSTDRFIIAKVDGTVGGWLSTDQWNWINKNLY